MLRSLGPKPACSPVRPWRITERQKVHAPWKEASQSQALYMSAFRESPARMVPAGLGAVGRSPSIDEWLFWPPADVIK